MLDIDYPTKFGQLIQSVSWDIELPIQWEDYFDQRGEVTACTNDERSSQRLRIRTHGIMWFERSLPFRPRSSDPVGVYTRDFSRNGSGFLCPFEIYPTEELRIILPTFWVKLNVTRARRITSKCYEIGASLTSRHDLSEDAFQLECVAGI